MIAGLHRIHFDATIRRVVIQRDGTTVAVMVCTDNPFTQAQAVALHLDRQMPVPAATAVPSRRAWTRMERETA